MLLMTFLCTRINCTHRDTLFLLTSYSSVQQNISQSQLYFSHILEFSQKFKYTIYQASFLYSHVVKFLDFTLRDYAQSVMIRVPT